MTLSVIYFNNDKIDAAAVGIRCCADSLISTTYGSELTPHAMKILELRIAYTPIYYSLYKKFPMQHSIGFTFAGNLNVATITFNLLNYLCANIQPKQGKENTLPSIKTIANLASKILYSYMSTFSILLTQDSFAEIILFGYCLKEQKFKSYHIYPKINEKLFIQIDEIDLNNNSYFAIGSGKRLLQKKISQKDKFDPDIVREIISSPEAADYHIGGFFQRGWSNQWGMQLFCDALQQTPFGFGAPFCGFLLSPFDLGDHFISLPMFSDCLK